MKRFSYTILSIVMVAYLSTCAGLYFAQDALLYHPKPRAFSALKNTFILHSHDEKIIISTKQASGKKAIIYFGGNGEDASENLPIYEKTFPEHALYIMHYRSYGGSSGSPTEEANFADAKALLMFVKKAHTDISIIGRSLGTGIATRLVSEFHANHLVLITPYDSVEEIAAEKFPLIPVSLLLRDKYDSGSYVSKIRTPTTIFMAENDEVIPRRSTEMLFSRFKKDVATLQLIKGAGHNTISSHIDYLPALKHALDIS